MNSFAIGDIVVYQSGNNNIAITYPFQVGIIVSTSDSTSTIVRREFFFDHSLEDLIAAHEKNPEYLVVFPNQAIMLWQDLENSLRSIVADL